MLIYRSSIWETKIKEVEGVIGTRDIIYFEGVRRKQEHLQTDCYKWFESKEKASEATKENLVMRVLEAQKKLILAKQRLRDFKNSSK